VKLSFGLALLFHLFLFTLLVISFDRTIVITPDPSPSPFKKIINAEIVVAPPRIILDKPKEEPIKEEEKEDKLKEEKEKALVAEAQAQKKQQEEALILEKKKEKEKAKKEKEKQKALAKQVKEQAEADEKALAQAQANRVMNQDKMTLHLKLMGSKVTQHWRQPIGFDFTGFKCTVAVKLLLTGEVIEARVIESSGNVEFDRSAELAVRKASPLPMPEDPHLANDFRDFSFIFRP